MEYWIATEHIVQDVRNLIGQFHPEIATAEIYCQFKTKGSKAEWDRGQVVGVKKVPDIYKTITNDTDFVLTINSDMWQELTEAQRIAKLDSALCRCSVKLKEDGDFKLDEQGNSIWETREPDVVEFIEIIERYGVSVLAEIGQRLTAAVQRGSAAEENDE